MKVISPGMASLVGVKDWAKNELPIDNELRETILSEQEDSIPDWEASVKMETYSRMPDAKYKLMIDK